MKCPVCKKELLKISGSYINYFGIREIYDKDFLFCSNPICEYVEYTEHSTLAEQADLKNIRRECG